MSELAPAIYGLVTCVGLSIALFGAFTDRWRVGQIGMGIVGVATLLALVLLCLSSIIGATS